MLTPFRPAISRCRSPPHRAGLRRRPDAKRLTKIAEAWRPWRGVAAHLLWAYYHVVKRREGISLQTAAKQPTTKKKTRTRKSGNG
jgi:DNA-3-methyladenine glycosylase II